MMQKRIAVASNVMRKEDEDALLLAFTKALDIRTILPAILSKDEDIDINITWNQAKVKFRPSTEDLLSDYVDPIAEFHMTLPETKRHGYRTSMSPFVIDFSTVKKEAEVECIYLSASPRKKKQHLPMRFHTDRTIVVQTNKTTKSSNRFLRHKFVRM